MARRRRRRPKVGGYGGGRGPYKFTPARRRALQRAAEISARKRKRRRRNIAIGVAAGVAVGGTGGYLGHKYGGRVSGSVAGSVRRNKPKMARAANKARARVAVNPFRKEKVRKTSAASPASAPRNQGGTITDADRESARKQSKDIEYENYLKQRPHMRPDKDQREYNVDRFIPRAVIRGRKLRRSGLGEKQTYVENQVGKHVDNKGKITGESITSSEQIIGGMIADGSVSRSTRGRRTRTKTNRQVAGRKGGKGRKRSSKKKTTKRRVPRQTLKDKSFEQWLRDNPDG